MMASPRLVEELVLILVRRLMSSVERCARLDGGLIELDVGDGVAGGVGERCAQAAIGADAERAAALDAPSAGGGVGGVDVGGVG